MKTQYYVASSLDGFIAGPDDSLDWLLQFGDGSGDSYSAFIRDVGGIVMGSTTYEWMLRHLSRPDTPESTWPYQLPVWVFTHRDLPSFNGAAVAFVEGDVAAVFAQIRSMIGGKNLWIVGGGDLAGQFHDLGLLDELFVHVAPVTLGSGAPLLPRAITSPPLKLISAAGDAVGFVKLHYQVARNDQ